MAAYGDASTFIAARETPIKGAKVIAFKVADNVKIFKGDMVRIQGSTGYAIAGDGTASLAQYDCFAGIALETVDNTGVGHAAGASWVRVQTEGSVALVKSVSADTDRGCRALHSATVAYVVTASATTLCAVNGSDDANNEVHIGWIWGRDYSEGGAIGGTISTARLRIKLQTLRQAYQ